MATNIGLQPNAEVVLVLRRRCRWQVEQWLASDQGAEETQLVDALTEAVTRVLLNNLADGRVARVVRAWSSAEAPPSPLRAEAPGAPNNDLALLVEWWPEGAPFLDRYMARLVRFYVTEQPTIARLEACDPAAWDELVEMLARRAGGWLRQWEVEGDWAADAREAAQEACEIIYRHPFHYDVFFEAWALLILKNVLRQRYRGPDVLNRPRLARLDDDADAEAGGYPPRHELVHDSGAAVTEMVEAGVWLDQVLGRLKSRAQQYVLKASFADGLEDEEIAHHLGKSVNAVYILRYRALQRLKEIMSRTAPT